MTNPVPPTTDSLRRDDFEAVLAARSELGGSMEPALVDSFAARVNDEIRRQAYRAQPPKPPSAAPQVAVAIVSLLTLVALVPVCVAMDSALTLLLLVPAIVAINVALAWSRRPR